jgi:hypothetical protein
MKNWGREGQMSDFGGQESEVDGRVPEGVIGNRL